MQINVCAKYTYVFFDYEHWRYIYKAMKRQICYTCEAICNSLSEDCPSCGTLLSSTTVNNFNLMPLIVAVCASFLIIGAMIGAAA